MMKKMKIKDNVKKRLENGTSPSYPIPGYYNSIVYHVWKIPRDDDAYILVYEKNHGIKYLTFNLGVRPWQTNLEDC